MRKTSGWGVRMPEPAEGRAPVRLTVNGEPHEVAPGSPHTLVDLLRDRLRLTGTKLSCGGGFCGACTVLVGGVAESACSVLVGDLDGMDVVTVEGLADGEVLHPVQAAFVEELGFQCGYCTPGMIMTTVALLHEAGEPTDAEIRQYFEGNVCRCTGYGSIVAAVRRAAARPTGPAPREEEVGVDVCTGP
jgi:aerobic-type carbon monoxide dehydrogenase small subunit (CoxS/CutS family)